MNIKTVLKSSVAAAALFAVAAPAQAGTVSNGNDTASVTLSGHFNKALLWMDSGDASRLSVVGNNNSRTRGRIVVKGKVNEALSVGAVSEWGMESNVSSSVSPADPNTAGTNPEVGSDAQFDQRHTYVKFDHKQFGSLRMGQTSEATDGITENAHHGAFDVVYPGNTVVGNGIHLQASGAATGVYSANTVGDFISVGGEGGRTDTVRYDTPSMGGFSVATSFQADQSVSASANFSGKFGGISVDAGFGATDDSAASTTVDRTHGGSVALSHDSGINIAGSYGKSQLKNSANRNDPTNWGVLVGYKAKLVSTGSTNFAVGYSTFEDASANGDELTLLSVGVEQDTDAGVKFYLGYQLFQAEQTGVDYEDASTIMAGTKVYF